MCDDEVVFDVELVVFDDFVVIYDVGGVDD